MVTFPVLVICSHPDVMLESYKLNGWSAVFFIIFLVITLYLLTNVVCTSIGENATYDMLPACNAKCKIKLGHALNKLYSMLLYCSSSSICSAANSISK